MFWLDTPMMGSLDPSFQVAENEVDHRQVSLGLIRVTAKFQACARYLNPFVGLTVLRARSAELPENPIVSRLVRRWLRCRKCKPNTSLTAGTVMQSSHTPLSTWFWGAYLMTTESPGQSAVQFQRQLGLTRYETAFQILHKLHKLRAGMVRPERDAIGGKYPVEVDECYIGGETLRQSGLTHPLIQAGPKVCVKTLFRFRNSSYFSTSGLKRCSGMLGMRS